MFLTLTRFRPVSFSFYFCYYQASGSSSTGGADPGAFASGRGGSAAAAEPMTPLFAMNPPLTAPLAKSRIKALHTAAFVQAKRPVPPVPSEAGSSSSSSSTVAAASAGPAAAVAASANGNASGDGDCVVVAASGSSPSSAAAAPGPAVPASSAGDGQGREGAGKRATPEVVVLDLCVDDEGGEEGSGGGGGRPPTESPAKKLKLVSVLGVCWREGGKGEVFVRR